MKMHVLSILFTLSTAFCLAQSSGFFKKTPLIQNTGNKPFVIVVFSTDCPICQKYTSILRGIADSFSNVKFLLVFSKWDSLQAIKNFDKEQITQSPNHQITPLWDKKNKLIKKLKATTTPEVFFFDKNGNLKYRGAIDNWFYTLGRYRPEATEHYLKNALTQYLKNEQITVSKTNPVGCLIEY